MELTVQDPQIGEKAASLLHRMERLLCQTLEAAQAQGQLAAASEPHLLARLLLHAAGLGILAQTGPNPEMSTATVNNLFALLEP